MEICVDGNSNIKPETLKSISLSVTGLILITVLKNTDEIF